MSLSCSFAAVQLAGEFGGAPAVSETTLQLTGHASAEMESGGTVRDHTLFGSAIASPLKFKREESIAYRHGPVGVETKVFGIELARRCEYV